MASVVAHIAAGDRQIMTGSWSLRILAAIREEPGDVQALTLAIWSVPLSIAVTEFFLSVGLLCKIVRSLLHSG